MGALLPLAMICQGKLLFVQRLTDLRENVLEVSLSVTETGVPFPNEVDVSSRTGTVRVSCKHWVHRDHPSRALVLK